MGPPRERAAGRHLALTPGSGSFQTQYRATVAEVDSWENTWFDVADAALSRSSPEVHGVLFKNLSKVSGSGTVLTVRTFLDRLDALQEEEGEPSREAMALLEKRGLTAKRREEARALLAKVESVELTDDELDTSDQETTKAKREQALDAMWDWFQDWAKTARTVVKNRNYQAMLGLTSPRGGATDKNGDHGAAEDRKEAPSPAAHSPA